VARTRPLGGTPRHHTTRPSAPDDAAGGLTVAETGSVGLDRSLALAASVPASSSGEREFRDAHFDDACPRFRYQGTWAWWWQIDDVVVEDACAVVPGGLVVGTISDPVSGAAIDGATVTGDAPSSEAATTGPTPDDPNVGDGFYTLFSAGPGTRQLTARADGRTPATHPVDVAADSVVRRNFQLAVAPPVGLSIADARTNEPDRATAPMTFTLTAAPAPSSPVTVLVRPTAGTARAGADFTALPTAAQHITFAAGQRTRQVTIPIVGDLLREPTEIFTISLADPTGATLADSTAVGTIVDNDNCTIVGTAGHDTLRGTPAHDEICGLGGNDVLLGGAGNDTLRGGQGNDVLNGQAGDDRLDGGGGVDLGSWAGAPSVGVDLTSGRAVGWGRDTLIGLENVQGGASGDRITGSTRANVLVGGQGNDQVRGAAGNDTLRGGDGNDVLDGQAGIDHVDGGAGNDTCSPATSRDTRRRCERP
jgi:Ca2+-binding RTX toxin-like protein